MAKKAATKTQSKVDDQAAKPTVAESTDDVQNDERPKATVDIQKIYVKDASYEAPNTPAAFRGQWQPHINLELNTHNEKLDGDDVYEVVLDVTVTVKLEDKVTLIVEVKHGGIFTIKGLEGEALQHTLGSFCPNVIFPYLREFVSDLVVRGGFPQLNLAPINFEVVYQQFKQQQNANQGN